MLNDCFCVCVMVYLHSTRSGHTWKRCWHQHFQSIYLLLWIGSKTAGDWAIHLKCCNQSITQLSFVYVWLRLWGITVAQIWIINHVRWLHKDFVAHYIFLLLSLYYKKVKNPYMSNLYNNTLSKYMCLFSVYICFDCVLCLHITLLMKPFCNALKGAL